uniref:Homeobox domain-containing protein n=1 Tax=Steinernema glaseri TaxID=37863 RepID=A0A1I7ZK52_9BILA
MQKLTTWFEDRLSLRRRSFARRSDKKTTPPKASRSAAPKIRYSVSAVGNPPPAPTPHKPTAIAPPMSQSLHGDLLTTSWTGSGTMSGSLRSTRQKIRTNPWVLVRGEPRDNLPQLKAKTLVHQQQISCRDPTSSSSSPECSVHSPDWQPSSKLAIGTTFRDVAVDCHSIDVDEALCLDEEVAAADEEAIYHEIESYNRLSMAWDDDGFRLVSPRSNVPPRFESPIYAEPFEVFGDDDDWAQCSTASSSFTRLHENVYAEVGGAVVARPKPRFHPPPPPIAEFSDEEVEKEMKFLEELDQQIAELKAQSSAIEQLVAEARCRRHYRTLHLPTIPMFLSNTFELSL